MRLRLIVPFLILPAPSVAQLPERPFAPVTIPNTEVRSLRSKVTGRAYDIYVYRPTRVQPGKRYPVLYLLDAQWDFKLLASIQGGLFYDRFVPDVIVVGITYSGPNANYDSLRAVDYTPRGSPSNPGSGQGAKFLTFLETELIPFVESDYSGDPARRMDYQIWCGPAQGAFNDWVKGSFLEPVGQRSAVQIALNLLEGAAMLTRAQQLRSFGLPVPSEAFRFAPRPLDS